MGGVVVKAQQRNFLLLQYTDHHNEVLKGFKKLRLGYGSQIRLLEKWSQMDTNKNNKVELEEFVSFFGLPKNVWSTRVYKLMDTDNLNAIHFLNFVQFICLFCPVHRKCLLEFSFRVLSRRGAIFDEKNTIIDVHDIRDFLEQRYLDIGVKEVNKRAVALFEEFDSDMSGGITLDEFEDLAKSSADALIFVGLGWFYLDKIRLGLFSQKYWKRLTPVTSTEDRAFFSQISEVSRIATDACSFSGFNDDFPVLKKIMQQKKAEKKERLALQRTQFSMTSKGYMRLVNWFYRVAGAGDDPLLQVKAAFGKWVGVTHGTEGNEVSASNLQITQGKVRFLLNKNSTETQENEARLSEGSMSFSSDQSPKKKSRSHKRFTANFSKLTISTGSSANQPELGPAIVLKSPSPAQGTKSNSTLTSTKHASSNIQKTIYDVLNEPQEARWIPTEMLYNDYQQDYVRLCQENSKYNNEPFISGCSRS